MNGKIEVLDSFEDVLLIFLDRNTPPAKTSQEIADSLKMAYPTIHPKLKNLHKLGLIEGREDQTSRPGKKRLLWEKKGDLDALLDKWSEILQSK